MFQLLLLLLRDGIKKWAALWTRPGRDLGPETRRARLGLRSVGPFPLPNDLLLSPRHVCGEKRRDEGGEKESDQPSAACAATHGNINRSSDGNSILPSIFQLLACRDCNSSRDLGGFAELEECTNTESALELASALTASSL